MAGALAGQPHFPHPRGGGSDKAQVLRAGHVPIPQVCSTLVFGVMNKGVFSVKMISIIGPPVPYYALPCEDGEDGDDDGHEEAPG